MQAALIAPIAREIAPIKPPNAVLPASICSFDFFSRALATKNANAWTIRAAAAHIKKLVKVAVCIRQDASVKEKPISAPLKDKQAALLPWRMRRSSFHGVKNV